MVYREKVARGTTGPADVCPMSEAAGLSLSEEHPWSQAHKVSLSVLPQNSLNPSSVKPQSLPRKGALSAQTG